jgi:hypothetical protein
MMNRALVVEQLRETQKTLEKLLALLESSERDRFAEHLYHSRREFRMVCERAGKGGKMPAMMAGRRYLMRCTPVTTAPGNMSMNGNVAAAAADGIVDPVIVGPGGAGHHKQGHEDEPYLSDSRHALCPI